MTKLFTLPKYYCVDARKTHLIKKTLKDVIHDLDVAATALQDIFNEIEESGLPIKGYESIIVESENVDVVVDHLTSLLEENQS